jgi:hypothetical protein
MPASRARGTSRIGRASWIPIQQLVATPTGSQVTSPPASSTSPRTQSSSSVSSSTPPPSPAGPLVPSCSPSPVSTMPSTAHSTPPQQSDITLQSHSLPPASASNSGPTPAAATASLQKRSFLSTSASALWVALRRNRKGFLGACITTAVAIVGTYLAVVTLGYTRWTKHNDFRDGCINDRDHGLPLAVECFAEFARPRSSGVNVERDLGTGRNALNRMFHPQRKSDYDYVFHCHCFVLWLVYTTTSYITERLTGYLIRKAFRALGLPRSSETEMTSIARSWRALPGLRFTLRLRRTLLRFAGKNDKVPGPASARSTGYTRDRSHFPGGRTPHQHRALQGQHSRPAGF